LRAGSFGCPRKLALLRMISPLSRVEDVDVSVRQRRAFAHMFRSRLGEHAAEEVCEARKPRLNAFSRHVASRRLAFAQTPSLHICRAPVTHDKHRGRVFRKPPLVRVLDCFSREALLGRSPNHRDCPTLMRRPQSAHPEATGASYAKIPALACRKRTRIQASPARQERSCS